MMVSPCLTMCHPVAILLSGLHYSLVELVRNVHWWPPVLVPTQRGAHLFAPLQRMSCVSFTQTSRVNYWSTSSHVCDLKQRINMPISYHVMRYVRSPQFFTWNWLECTTWRNKDNAWTYAMSQDASSWRLGYKPLWYLKSIDLIAFESIEHLSSMKQYINMLLALLGWSVRISPAAWNDELVGPGRILRSIQSRGSRVSSSQRLSAWTIWSASSVERARWSCPEMRQTERFECWGGDRTVPCCIQFN